ncbi:Imm52 family immunity protein [Nitrospirillum sp. BR 11164]|uniref:Imm52 family immunity protein n=1 Tax=Nitrospirillum sp. BR 11164 TaxID=3104324 RepID=UPI002AFF4BD8|nr:Imm52 family immunity protein [Nitrospirillum sp. BR 11164]MEA1649362.1 Imm52 family immunity protein [Nitrospirillum sp. BR 11164]
MAQQDLVIGAYWGPRRETAEDCASRAAIFFDDLVQTAPLLARWYERGRSRKDALALAVDVSNRDALRKLLLKGQNRKDANQEVIADLGFRIGLWNGAATEEGEAGLSILCGGYHERVRNNVVLDLPRSFSGALTAEGAAALLAATAKAWNPDWAGVMTRQAMESRDFSGRRPFVDWLVYVPRTMTSPPAPSTVAAVASLGSIIVVQPTPPGNGDTEALQRIQRVEALLAAG